MAKRSSSLFEADSDTDSITTNTTASEAYDDDHEFAVEHILAEEMKPDGEMHYLLKWEAYPLYACTWEPASSITSKQVLQDWKRDKVAVRNGERKGFDVEVFNLAVENHFQEKEEKARRRAAKRRKRGEVVVGGSPEDGEVGESEGEVVRSPKVARVRNQAVKRKGVAQPITKARKRAAVVRDEGGDSSSDSDEFQPASATKVVKKPTSASPTSKKPRTLSNSKPPALTKSSTQAPTPAAQPKQTESQKGPSGNAVASSEGERVRSSDLSAQPIPSGAARKSVPAPAAKPAPPRRSSKSNISAGDPTEEKKVRQRQRVSGETPKDSTDAQFTKLSIQNRYQKYGRNEPAPDPNALSMVDPKTGIVEPPKIAPPKARPTEIHSAYGRRTPPPASRGRSASPKPTSTIQPTPDTNVGTSGALVEGRRSSTGKSLKHITCKHWQAGDCWKTEATCPWAHHHTGTTAVDPGSAPTRSVTCYFWKEFGVCNKSDKYCEFAHHDTGIYAGQPGTFKRSSIPQHLPAIRPSDSAPAASSSSPTWASFDAPERAAPPAVIAAAPAKMTAPEVQWNNPSEALAGRVNDRVESFSTEQPRKISNASANDPRLANRSLTVDTMSRSPPKDPRWRPPPAEIPEMIAEPTTMTNYESTVDDSIDNDLKMAQKGIRNLDATRLLRTSTGPINEVYIHMPPERKGEMGMLKDYLTNELNCKVYGTNSDPNIWKYFRNMFKKTPCLLIVHPSENFIRSLPDLHPFLMENATLRVFSIGVQHAQCLQEQRAPAYEAQRLFPHGGITFISDDVFAYYPEKATEIINRFLEDTKPKPPGAESTKIGARPGIKDWILRLAQKKYEEHLGPGAYTDDRWVKCYEALCQLCPFEQEDPDFPNQSVPLETSHLWSLWEDALPSFKGRWESGDEEGATGYMVNLFAGEACSKAWKYRKFLFVYQRPGGEKEAMEAMGRQESDPKGWMKRYNHIGVMTPEQVLRFMKGKRGG